MATDLKTFDENRKRNKRATIRFTDEEYSAIKEKMALAGKTSLNDYLVQMGTGGFVLIQDFDNLIEVSRKINKIGVNINQIAHKINTDNLVLKEDLRDIKEMITNIEQLIFDTFNKANKEI